MRQSTSANYTVGAFQWHSEHESEEESVFSILKGKSLNCIWLDFFSLKCFTISKDIQERHII